MQSVWSLLSSSASRHIFQHPTRAAAAAGSLHRLRCFHTHQLPSSTPTPLRTAFAATAAAACCRHEASSAVPQPALLRRSLHAHCRTATAAIHTATTGMTSCSSPPTPAFDSPGGDDAMLLVSASAADSAVAPTSSNPQALADALTALAAASEHADSAASADGSNSQSAASSSSASSTATQQQHQQQHSSLLLPPRKMPYDYRNKVMLAPMVRVGTLPSRLLALQYGADLVYSEEIIDHRMIRAKRTYNPHLHSVDFVQPDGTVIFRTCPAERGKLVFQMGTADPARAVAVARLVMHDVLAVDVNMGCPKSYSTDGGMGAALLKHPDKIHAILTALVAAVGEHVHVTCKIRVLATVEETVALAKMIESTGVSALAVHCRLTHERPREPGHPDMLKPIVDALSIPVIANGGSLDIVSHDDIEAFRQRTGCASVMVARAAQNNPSVFRPEPLVPRLEMARQLLRTGIEWDNPSGNTKFCINTLANDGSWVTPHGFTQCESHAAMCPFLGIDPAEVVAIQERRRAAAVLERERDGDLVVVVGGGAHSSAPTAKRNLQRANSSEEASGDATSLVTDETENASKRMRMDAADPTPTNVDPLLHETNTIHMPLIFLSDTIVRPQPYPKALVDILANRPQFTTDEANRMFRVRLVEPETGTQFCSSLFDKRKKVSEHAAALVYLLHRHPTEAAQFAQSYKLRGDDEHKQFVFQNDAPVVSESTPAAI